MNKFFFAPLKMKKYLNYKFLLGISLITFVYLLLNVYMTNHLLFNSTFLGGYSWSYKWAITSSLVWGLPEMIGVTGFTVLLIVGMLTGFNLMLLLQRNPRIFSFRSGHFVFGFGTLMGTAGAGCPSCGIPLLGMLGLSSSISFLPFKGLELSVLAIGFLVISCVVLIRQNEKACVLRR